MAVRPSLAVSARTGDRIAPATGHFLTTTTYDVCATAVVSLLIVRVLQDFTGCRLRAQINNGEGLDNQEQGAPVRVCSGERVRWSRLWPALRHYD
jgi:hypothetical protein